MGSTCSTPIPTASDPRLLSAEWKLGPHSHQGSPTPSSAHPPQAWGWPLLTDPWSYWRRDREQKRVRKTNGLSPKLPTIPAPAPLRAQLPTLTPKGHW